VLVINSVLEFNNIQERVISVEARRVSIARYQITEMKYINIINVLWITTSKF